MPVECTNCGEIGPIFWITLGALAVAAGGLVIAFREHREFMRQLRARAEFRLAVRTMNADEDGVLRTEGNTVYAMVEIGLKNTGRKAAGPTILNVLAPLHMKLRWCGPKGEEIPAKSAAETSGTLRDPDGREYQAEYLADELRRVGLRPHYVRFVRLFISVPDDEQATVPMRVVAQADELPDEIDELTEDFVLRVERG